MHTHVGITVALSRFDQIYFGFFRDHRKLAVQRTGRELSPIADLGERRNLFRQTALRVVKRGQRLLFQAAEPETSDLINAPSNDVLPFAGLTRDRFNTVAVLNVRERPVGVGVLLKTWGYPLLVEADYSEIVLSDRLGRRSFPVDRDPVEFPRDAPYQNALSSNEIRRFDMPGPPLLDRASFVRAHRQDRVLQLGARYCVNPIVGDPVNLENADHWDGVDRAPKALIQVQSGNFTFGVRMRVRRCIFSPWTAGGAVGSTIWGHYGRRIFARDIIIPSRIRERWRGNSMLLFAFIVVARRNSDITENQLAIIDHIRRFWDTIFNVVTRGRWTSNSNLWPAVYEPEPIA